MALQALKKRESFSDKAYHMLREAILTGELKPGEQLTEEALSAQLGISRTQSIRYWHASSGGNRFHIDIRTALP